MPALFFVALGVERDRNDAFTWVMVAAPLCLVAIHFAYFFQDLTFGPRYLYEGSVIAFPTGVLYGEKLHHAFSWDVGCDSGRSPRR